MANQVAGGAGGAVIDPRKRPGAPVDRDATASAVPRPNATFSSMDLDLRLVRYAVALADEQHFGRAAERLLIAEQTLSAQIKRLEQRVGVVLFLRDRRGVTLTTAGVAFIRRGRRLLADAEVLLDDVRSATPSLRVDVLTDGLWPSAVVQSVRRVLPQVTIEIAQGQGMTATVPRVAAGEVDLAFGWTGGLPGHALAGLNHAHVRFEPVGLVLPTDHQLADRPDVRPSDLTGQEMLIHAATEAPEWQRWQEEFASAFDTRVTARITGHGQASVQIAVTTHRAPALGTLGIVPGHDVVSRPLVDPTPLHAWSVIWRAEHDKPGLAEVIETIREMSVSERWLEPAPGSWWMPDADRDATAVNRS